MRVVNYAGIASALREISWKLPTTVEISALVAECKKYKVSMVSSMISAYEAAKILARVSKGTVMLCRDNITEDNVRLAYSIARKKREEYLNGYKRVKGFNLYVKMRNDPDLTPEAMIAYLESNGYAVFKVKKGDIIRKYSDFEERKF